MGAGWWRSVVRVRRAAGTRMMCIAERERVLRSSKCAGIVMAAIVARASAGAMVFAPGMTAGHRAESHAATVRPVVRGPMDMTATAAASTWLTCPCWV